KERGIIGFAVAPVSQELLKAVRLGRIEESEDTSLVLSEPAARHWAQKCSYNRMQRTAPIQPRGQLASVDASRRGDAFGDSGRSLWAAVAQSVGLDCACE